MLADKLPEDDDELHDAVTEFVTAMDEQEKYDALNSLLEVAADRDAIVRELVVDAANGQMSDLTKGTIQQRMSEVASEKATEELDINSATRVVPEDEDRPTLFELSIEFRGETAEFTCEASTLTSPKEFVDMLLGEFDGVPYIGKRSDWVNAIDERLQEIEVDRRIEDPNTPEHAVVERILKDLSRLSPTPDPDEMRRDGRSFFMYDEDADEVLVPVEYAEAKAREVNAGDASMRAVSNILAFRGYLPDEGRIKEDAQDHFRTFRFKPAALMESGHLEEAQITGAQA